VVKSQHGGQDLGERAYCAAEQADEPGASVPAEQQGQPRERRGEAEDEHRQRPEQSGQRLPDREDDEEGRNGDPRPANGAHPSHP